MSITHKVITAVGIAVSLTVGATEGPIYADALDDTQIHNIQLCENGLKAKDKSKEASGRRVVNQGAITSYNQGNQKLMLDGDYQGAIANYTQAIQLNPKFDAAYVNRGNARLWLLDCQGAIADYTQAIRINPNSATAYVYRSRVRLALRDQQGREDASQALQIKLKNATDYYSRVWLTLKLKTNPERSQTLPRRFDSIPTVLKLTWLKLMLS